MYRAFILLLLLPAAASADRLWLEAAGAEGTAYGSRFGASRSLDSFGLQGATVGLKHNRSGDAWWTLVDAGYSRRAGERWLIQGNAELGPGQIGNRNFSYRKLRASATWLYSQRWSVAFSDTWVNVDTTNGHVLGAAVTRYSDAGYSVTLTAMASAGSAIDARQVGASFRLPRSFTWIGGAYVGETSNPATLSQVGGQSAGNAARLRQAYVGLALPVGRYQLTGVFDYLQLDSAARRELSFVLTVPLGGSTR